MTRSVVRPSTSMKETARTSEASAGSRTRTVNPTMTPWAVSFEIRAVTVVGRLRDSGKTVVELTPEQVGRFAGNCIELTGGPQHGGGRTQALAMSTTAADSLRPDQLSVIERSCRVLRVPIPTIEAAGGSVRCMIAGNHLRARTPRAAP